MKKICVKVLLFVVFLFLKNSMAYICVEGDLPKNLTIDILDNEYRRIWKIIAPYKPIDTSELHIIYYLPDSRVQLIGKLPEWWRGGAFGKDTVIVSVTKHPVLGTSLEKVTIHEIVHIVISRAYPGIGIPRWFNEGCAMVLSGEISMGMEMALSKRVFFGKLPGLSSIDSVNSFSQEHAAFAYSESQAVLNFLIRIYGWEAIAEILNLSEKHTGFSAGFLSALGISEGEFEVLAYRYIRTRYGFVFLFGDLFFIWIFISFLFVAAYIVTIRRRKKKMEMMEQAKTVSDVDCSMGQI